MTNVTEDATETVAGLVVATFTTNDEDGDTVTVALSEADSVNYAIVDGTVVLTAAGAALANSGEELPEFTLTPSDALVSGESVSADPSVILANDAPTVEIASVTNVTEDAAETVAGLVVATFTTNDEDGDTVTVALSEADSVNYAIVDGTVVLTAAGAALANSGEELPEFTLTPSDALVSGESVSADPSVILANDAPTVEIASVTNVTEDAAETVAGLVVATFTTNDEDGDTVTVALSEADSVNYAIVDGTVVLTAAGAALANSGEELPEFTLTPSDALVSGESVSADPSVILANDAPTVEIASVTNVTEDAAETVAGLVVATFTTNDEDGDTVTVALSEADSVNYAIVDGTVVLTAAGAALANSGEELPEFTLTPSDALVSGESVSADPSVILANDAPTVEIASVTNVTEDAAETVAGLVVATFTTNDEDGDTVTVALSEADSVNYAIVDGTVVLTAAGAALANSGEELPEFTLTPSDALVSGESVSADPSVILANDAPTVEIASVTNVTEDAAETVAGLVVATFTTNDEDGDTVTVALSEADSVNYAIVDGTVVLTAAGAALANSGEELPEFTLTPSDALVSGESVSADPSVILANDAPTVEIASVTNVTEDAAETVAGLVVATFTTNDEDGDTVTVALSEADSVNYAIVDGTVVLTAAGAALANSGEELPEFTLTPSDALVSGESVSADPSVILANDAPTVEIASVTNVTEDAAETVADLVVATFTTNDEDGDTVTVALSEADSVNYAIVDGTVVLTAAGAALANSGEELPEFTLTPSDALVSGESVSADPSVILANDAPTVEIASVTNVTEDAAETVAGLVVATFTTNDEDGDTVTVALSEADSVNYAIVDGTVVLTAAGAALANSGEELPEFTLTPSDALVSGESVSADPSVILANDAPTVEIASVTNVTEDAAETVAGLVVATFTTNDEDGDTVTVALSEADSVNYAIVDGTVVLTAAGAALANSGEELPEFTLTPSDALVSGESVSADPSVILANDAPTVEIASVTNVTEDAAETVAGLVVATFTTNDEDGDTVTVALSEADSVNYAIVDGTVVLTAAGAALANSGEELPEFTLTPSDALVSGESVSADPSVILANDAPTVEIASVTNVTEDAAETVAGLVVATFTTNDEDGDTVTVALSEADSVNYAIVDGTVVLTAAGAALANSGEELPEFTLTPSDALVSGESVSADPSVILANDAPTVEIASVTNVTEDATETVAGLVVATFTTNDEDGDTVTVALSEADSVNYAIVDGTVVLTAAGAALANSGEELPEFTLTPSDALVSGESVSADPSVILANDAPTVEIASVTNVTEDAAETVAGLVVATFTTNDEDGDTVTVALSEADSVNYAIVDGTVVLTAAGAALANSGEELPEFTLTPSDALVSGESVSADPSVILANDAPTVEIASVTNVTEDAAETVAGLVVATFTTNDEDGDTVTVALSEADSVNYAIVDGTVVLTAAGAALANSGEELPEFTLTPSDALVSGESVSADPSVILANDAPTVEIASVTNVTEDAAETVAGLVVATFTTNDEDGDTVTVALSEADSVNYAIVDGTVVLTAAGAALANSGEELPEFTLTPSDALVSGESVSADPSVILANDAPTVEIASVTNVTEDAAETVAGLVVATFTTNDEDGDTVTVALSEADSVNYAIVDGTVVLTAAGAALANSGEELPEFTLTPSDALVNGESVSADPSVILANDAPTVEIASVTNVTEDAAETVAGLVVATFTTNDEDGDTVTVALSEADSVNYAIVDGTVVLTAAGAALANSGEELPEFTLTPSDALVSGESVSADPSVILANDAPTVEIASVTNVTEDAAETVAGLVVATFTTNDEDGDTVTVALSEADSVNYAIVDGTVVLTAAGAALANSGEELPEFTLTPSDALVSGESVSADPSVILANDAPTVEIASVTNVTEDAAETVAGLVVATFTTNDEDGDTVTVALSEADSVNYAIVDGTVVLTAAGAALANSGEELPEFTLTPSDALVSGESVSADPSVILANDAPTVEIASVTNVTEDAAETVAGLVVATFTTNDEDGDTVTVALSEADSVNYAIVDGTVVLTAAGAALANSGEELPEFTLTPSDALVSGESVSADPSVILANDAPTVEIASVTNCDRRCRRNRGRLGGRDVYNE